jgi:hypothetical protein
MQFFADLLLAGAAAGAALYCLILSRRLQALGSLEGSMGSAIAVLSRQVDELSRSLKSAQESANRAAGVLDGQTDRAEAVARRLELLVASMHDLPASPAARPPSPWPAETARRPPEPAPEPEPAPQRARILRRRGGPEGV